MAAIANTAAELRVSNHLWEKNKNITGKYQESATDTICNAGFLCKRAGRLPCDGYGTAIYNENAWLMNMADDTDATGEVYFCNTFDVQEIAAGDNIFRVGAKTLGLPIPAGERGTFTRIDGYDAHDQIRFGVGNFKSTPTVGQYATIEDGLLKPSASAATTTGELYFEILATGYFTEGAYQGFAYYDVRAVRVTTVAG